MSDQPAPTKLMEGYLDVESFAAHKGYSTEKAIQMIKDGFYSGRVFEGAWFVEEKELGKATVSKSIPQPEPIPGKFIQNLFHGRYGLRDTFWLYGVLISIALAFLLIGPALLLKSMVLGIVGILVLFGYQFIAYVGTWKASDNYQGPKVWALLAKLTVILGIFRLLRLIFEIATKAQF